MSDLTAPRYDTLAIAFHWTCAAAILVALPLGFLAANAPDSRQAVALLRVHAPLGILILAVTLVRAVWRSRHAAPPAPADQPRWQAGAARISHVLLYVVPIVLGASGLGLMVLSGAAPVIFSEIPGVLPDFSHYPPMTVHAIAALMLVGLIFLHLAAAVHHHFFRRDRLLARMGIGATPDSQQC